MVKVRLSIETSKSKNNIILRENRCLGQSCISIISATVIIASTKAEMIYMAP